MTAADDAAVPEEWQQIGFTGLFRTEASLHPEVDVADLAARLPVRLPYGSNSGWLAVAVDPERRVVTVVRRDIDAVCDLVFTPAASRTAG